MGARVTFSASLKIVKANITGADNEKSLLFRVRPMFEKHFCGWNAAIYKQINIVLPRLSLSFPLASRLFTFLRLFSLCSISCGSQKEDLPESLAELRAILEIEIRHRSNGERPIDPVPFRAVNFAFVHCTLKWDAFCPRSLFG